VELERPDSSECKDTGVSSVVKYKFLSFLLRLLNWGFQSIRVMPSSGHCTA
jgi:hypothetical protein